MRFENVFPVILFGLVGLGLIACGVPLIRRTVAPGAFGLRTGETLGDGETWYAANRYTGRDVVVFGALLCLYAVANVWWHPVRDPTNNAILLVVFSQVAGLTIAIRGWLFGIRYAASKRERLKG